MAATPVTSLDQARAEVHAKGYAVVPNVLPSRDTAHIAEVAMQVSATEMTTNADDSFTVDHDGRGRRAPRKIDYPFLKHQAFREFILDQRIQQLAARVLGGPGYLMRDQLFCKPPFFGTAKPYHQENASLGYSPPEAMIVTWIALDDATPENGCLRVIEGSHRALLPHDPQPGAGYNYAPNANEIDHDREVLLPVDAGGVVVLHSQVLHYSAPNPSPQWRRAYTGHWVAAGVSCTTDAQRYGYSRTAGHGQNCPFRAP